MKDVEGNRERVWCEVTLKLAYESIKEESI